MYSNIIIVYIYIVHIPGSDDRQDNKSNHQHKKHQGWWRVIITIVTMRWIWYEYQHSSTSKGIVSPRCWQLVVSTLFKCFYSYGLIGSSQVSNKPLNGIIGSSSHLAWGKSCDCSVGVGKFHTSPESGLKMMDIDGLVVEAWKSLKNATKLKPHKLLPYQMSGDS